MATLPIQNIDNDGLTPAYVAAAAGGDRCAPGVGSYLHVRNGGGSSVTVTLVTPGTVAGLAIADQPVTVAAGAESLIAVRNLYRDPVDGLAAVTYSAVTSVTVGSFRAPVDA